MAKHGNRGITSKSGSADVLAALGVNIEAGIATVERCLDELGICFCFAPLHAPFHETRGGDPPQTGNADDLQSAGPALQSGLRTVTSCWGWDARNCASDCRPLCGLLGTTRAAVVCGADGLDEVTLNGPTHVSLVEGEATSQLTWSPADFGVPESTLDALLVDGPAASAAMIRSVLSGATRCSPRHRGHEFGRSTVGRPILPDLARRCSSRRRRHR